LEGDCLLREGLEVEKGGEAVDTENLQGETEFRNAEEDGAGRVFYHFGRGGFEVVE
jgi:hypothetical protein